MNRRYTANPAGCRRNWGRSQFTTAPLSINTPPWIYVAQARRIRVTFHLSNCELETCNTAAPCDTGFVNLCSWPEVSPRAHPDRAETDRIEESNVDLSSLKRPESCQSNNTHRMKYFFKLSCELFLQTESRKGKKEPGEGSRRRW